MILKGSQRAGGSALAAHLLRQDENDHVAIHQVRGFVRNNLIDAFKEAFAVSRGTKCKQFLFSLSLSPPTDETVAIDVFEKAIDKIEARLGLIGQPRAIVFHEKNGRRHAHCVWSRIDAKTMRARQMGHFKLKLNELSRELYMEHGWAMPRGFIKSEEANPLNFTQAEWQQAKRIERDPRRIKEIFKECWAASDNGAALKLALEARGYYLAQGDRRGYVAVDWQGEIYALARWCGVKTKDVEQRLGDPAKLPAIAAVRAMIDRLTAAKEQLAPDATLDFEKARLALKQQRDLLVASQRDEREQLERTQTKRRQSESIERAMRLRKGLVGLWDWLTGKRARTIKRNQAEVDAALRRDRAELERLVRQQLKVRKELQAKIDALGKRREKRAETLQEGPTFRIRQRDIRSSLAPTRRRARLTRNEP